MRESEVVDAIIRLIDARIERYVMYHEAGWCRESIVDAADEAANALIVALTPKITPMAGDWDD